MNPLAIHLAAALLAIVPAASPAAQEPSPDSATTVVVDGASVARKPVPWMVGERLEYDVAFGKLRAGSGLMEVRAIEQVRGRDAFHIFFQVRGGIPLFRVHDVFESWMDTTTLSSLRFIQDLTLAGRRAAVDLVTPDFAALATSVGMAGESVSTVDGFAAAYGAAMQREGPTLIDVDITQMAPMTIRPQRPSDRRR